MNSLFKFVFNLIFILIVIFLADNTYSQVSQEWIHRYTGPESSTDTPADFIEDADGNFYLTGKSILSGGFSDIITVKYNSAGIRQWISKYGSLDNLNDEGIGVCVDNSGNVYIAGSSRSLANQYNMVLIKYDQSGVQQWIRQYNGLSNSDDISSGIAIDNNGFVYLAGYSYAAATGNDYVLVKYDLAGTFQWSQRWNGISNSDDYLRKICLTSTGDVVVSGSGYETGSSYDYVTLKYNGAGSLLWTKKYNGPSSLDDQLLNMKIDALDNVFICGKSVGSGTGYDYAAVKYNSAGVQQWDARYNRGPGVTDESASSLSLDQNGNVFVTGYSFQNGSYYDFVTIKYNSSGISQWTKIYNGPENYFDKATDVKADASGNVFVTGLSIKASDGTTDFTTIKYDENGDAKWIKSYNGPGNLDDVPIRVDIDKNGYPFVIGNSYSYFFRPFLTNPMCGTSDYIVLKYNTNGNFIWETRYDGSGTGLDESVSLTNDNNGNSYVAGYSYDNVANFDYATIKYNSAGAPQWVARYDGFNSIDKAASVFADNNGNVYTTGSSQGNGTSLDIATVKYNSDGIQQWVSRYNGPAGGEDYGVSVSVDASGNVYVTGYSDGTGSGKDYVTVKYNSSGIQQWASRYDAAIGANDFAAALKIDASGNVYVTGRSMGLVSAEDIATVKYNSAGSQQWAARFNGTANDSDRANSIFIDQSGNVLVTGKSKTGISNSDIATIKYSSSGAQQWVSYYSGTAAGNDDANTVLADALGNVYVCGNSSNNSTGMDYATIKYNSSGAQQWAVNYNGTKNGNDKASSMAIDGSANLYVTGFCDDIGSNIDYCTIKYDNNGILKWNKKYNYIDNDSDKAVAVKVDSQGNVYVTGNSKGIEGGQDFITIKYRQYNLLELKSFVEGFYNSGNNITVSDSMKVYLRSAVSPYAMVDSSSAVFNQNGNSEFAFTNVQNNVNYYLVLTHRNSLETWSAAGVSFQSSVLNYDFTTNSSQAFGNNLILKGSRYCVYSGDVAKDGIVDISDLLIIYNQNINFKSGYVSGDLNGDDIVDVSDMLIAYNNLFNFVSLIRP